jgi:hypothetical protein
MTVTILLLLHLELVNAHRAELAVIRPTSRAIRAKPYGN